MRHWQGIPASDVMRLARSRDAVAQSTLRGLAGLFGVIFVGCIGLLFFDDRQLAIDTISRIVPEPVVTFIQRENAPVGLPPSQVPLPTVAVPSPKPGRSAQMTPVTNTSAPLPSVHRPGEALSLPKIVTPSAPVGGGNTVVARRSSDGHFYFDTHANGGDVRMMFDTGATMITLRAEDAERLNINMAGLVYSARTSTANGVASAAPYTIESLTIGDITVTQVQALVARRGALTVSLLGQSFMAKLAKFDVEANTLTLQGR